MRRSTIVRKQLGDNAMHKHSTIALYSLFVVLVLGMVPALSAESGAPSASQSALVGMGAMAGSLMGG